MSGGINAYLDACRDISEAQWLDISDDGDREQADFWTIAQVVPGELRETGDRFARRWMDGLSPETGLECWFRRVSARLARRHFVVVEPWVILYSMTHALAGRSAPSPTDYARMVNLPIECEDFQRAVAASRVESPQDFAPVNWNADPSGWFNA